MAGNITITNTFASQAGPIPLSQLDSDYAQLVTALNTNATYANYYADSSGVANTITVTINSPQVFSYTTGVSLDVRIANANTGATTLNVNALGAKPVTNSDGTALIANQLLVGQIATLQYDGTNFQLKSVASGGALTFKQLTVGPPASGISLLVNGIAGGLPAINISAPAGVAPQLNLSQSGQQPVAIYNDNSLNDLVFFVNGAVRQRIASAGNVSINAPSGGTTLALLGLPGADNLTVSAAGQATGKFINSTNSVTNFIGADSTTGFIGTVTNNDFVIYANSSVRMRIGASGDITSRGVAICKYKAADTSRSSVTVPANDPDLVYAIPGAGTYQYEFLCYPVQASAGAVGIGWNFNYSGTYDNVASLNCIDQNGTTQALMGNVGVSSNVTNVFSTLGAFNSVRSGSIRATGTLVATGAGTFGFSWAQNTGSATALIIGKGSYLKITQLS